MLTWPLRLEALTDRAEQTPVTHLAAFGTELKITRPLVMTFLPSLSRVTVTALDAVFAAEAMQLQAQLLDFCLVATQSIKTAKALPILDTEALVVCRRIALAAYHELLTALLALAVGAALAIGASPVELS